MTVDLTFVPGGMSPDHLEHHLLDFTRKSQEAGYHGGLSANAHIALLQEPISNVHYVLDRMFRDPNGKRTNPFGCARTECMIWYMRGISHDWSSYGGNGFQNLRDGTPCMTFEEAIEDSYKLAVEYPGLASAGGDMEREEVARVRKRLKLPMVSDRQTDELCVYCNNGPAQGLVRPVLEDNEFGDAPDDEYEPDYDDNYVEEDEN